MGGIYIMTMKRWIAVVVASVLVFVSIGINTLSYLFTRDFTAILDDFASSSMTDFSPVVIEEGGKDSIAVLTVDGVIQDVGGMSSLLGISYDHQFFMAQLEEIEQDPTVKGVVLQVNSPGGGVVESAEIYEGLLALQESSELPIYVSMGGMAASGGYYISAPADKIFVNHETITGSIGVIMESVNYAKLAERFGIDFNTIKTGPYKDMMSANREMTEEERAMLQEIIGDSYERFVDIIVEGRGMSDEAVRKVADGRILNGRQAIESGLADDYGKLSDVIQAMKTDYDLENATVFEYSMHENLSSLFGLKMSQMFNQNFETELLGRILSDAGAPRMMYLYGNY